MSIHDPTVKKTINTNTNQLIFELYAFISASAFFKKDLKCSIVYYLFSNLYVWKLSKFWLEKGLTFMRE